MPDSPNTLINPSAVDLIALDSLKFVILGTFPEWQQIAEELSENPPIYSRTVVCYQTAPADLGTIFHGLPDKQLIAFSASTRNNVAYCIEPGTAADYVTVDQAFTEAGLGHFN
jgi:hypothetical protein